MADSLKSGENAAQAFQMAGYGVGKRSSEAAQVVYEVFSGLGLRSQAHGQRLLDHFGVGPGFTYIERKSPPADKTVHDPNDAPQRTCPEQLRRAVVAAPIWNGRYSIP